MQLIDDRIEVYAGLNDTGGIVEFFASCDDFENKDPATVSIGLITAIPMDYEEIYNS